MALMTKSNGCAQVATLYPVIWEKASLNSVGIIFERYVQGYTVQHHLKDGTVHKVHKPLKNLAIHDHKWQRAVPQQQHYKLLQNGGTTTQCTSQYNKEHYVSLFTQLQTETRTDTCMVFLYVSPSCTL